MRDEFSYDVAFSYAGEDRDYVERVAAAIGGRVRVFYDRYEQADLWGENLYAHLAEVYGRRSRFCVIFISKHYARNVWTSYERECAQARAFINNETYLLPARFDDTVLPGVSPAIGYVDLRSLSPEELGELLVKKVGSPAFPRPRARWRRWAVIPPALLVAGWAGFSLVSEAGGARGPASRAGARQTVEQVVSSDGAGSTTVLDGGLRVKRQAGGDTRQEVRATNGGTTIVNGDMDYNGP